MDVSGVHYSVCHFHVPFTYCLRGFFRKQDSAPPLLQVPRLVFLSVHIHYIIVVEIERQTQIDKKGERFQSCHLVGISSAGSGMTVHYFWEERKTQSTEWGAYCVLFPPFQF